MSATTKHARRTKRGAYNRVQLGKPNGVIQPRVQAAGPTHFGVVSVDCAKFRSKWMLCDFYGRVLTPPTVVEHHPGAFREAIAALKQAEKKHGLKDLLVAVERTGNYHSLAERAFKQAGYETRLVHPFVSCLYRQAEHPDDKTDDHDLAGIHRAAVHGFGLIEPTWDQNARELQELTRHRRRLVRLTSRLCCQIREHLPLLLPGYAELFDLWNSPLALPLACRAGSAEALRQAGLEGLMQWLREAGVGFQRRSLLRILAWAEHAPAADAVGGVRQQILTDLHEERLAHEQKIQQLEGEIAARLVRTRYILLLAIPGVNVVSAADLAGEAGPIGYYANANALTGRAGLKPGRYQSDQTDRPHGRLARCANRRLRDALMQAADNLVMTNHYFQGLAEKWKKEKRDPRWIRVRVAKRFSRLVFAIVSSGQLREHPCCRQQPSYVLDKLSKFHLEHATPLERHRDDLYAALEQLPPDRYAQEAQPLHEEYRRRTAPRSRSPQPLSTLLSLVLVRLGVQVIESKSTSEERASN